MSEKKLTNMLTRHHQVSHGLELHLQDKSTLRKQVLKKGEMLYRPYGRSDEAHYISTGLCKVYWKNEDNEEMIFAFYGEDEIALLPVDFIMETENQDIYMEAIMDTVVYTITKTQMKEIYQQYPEAAVLTDIIVNNIHRKRDWQTKILLQPEGCRYEWFCSWFPELRMLLVDKDIASFLGVSKSTLLRSKKDLLFKELKGKK